MNEREAEIVLEKLSTLKKTIDGAGAIELINIIERIVKAVLENNNKELGFHANNKRS